MSFGISGCEMANWAAGIVGAHAEKGRESSAGLLGSNHKCLPRADPPIRKLSSPLLEGRAGQPHFLGFDI